MSSLFWLKPISTHYPTTLTLILLTPKSKHFSKLISAVFLLRRYEDDPIIGQRLYREIRTVEVKKGKGKNVVSFPSYQWETVATNLDEFQLVSVSSSSDIPVFLSRGGKNARVNPKTVRVQTFKISINI